ncbi:endonuclease/exonuclease/phosphatase family protein [Phaeobacter inhibens]|uniref:endonuclease/exonuclease/phosphatase family protein n=1 Tax=Phaeobacter inhibens TaxID=221822 RepID=UPI000C99FEB8|nr:endonuclease/exonuclease/phosphatase family protein [Phaeobacter inhibens]AUQ61237.1 Metal-dependent hydrolase [Phaeobacter inhibens]AUQ81204.1 Metal-dependent hydrolase [Phaeobacter inhibens]AUQ88867.1 Metal-dependent hydrolase [Phaeobacter inhibens]AUR06481.1 Metal-dependent hydrolase [Phaeobacter inhibens]MDO6756520.1 endonuclease [Phaeobacter inhibens]
MTRVLDSLPSVSSDLQARIKAAPRNAVAHRALMTEVPAMSALQSGGKAALDALTASVSVVAWNVERCLFPEDTASHIQPLAPQVVLLSEVDHGMARTGQRHTTEAMAKALEMAYVFGVEFHELDLGGPTEQAFCTDDFNLFGWHGNAILSAVPPERVTLIRLDDHGHWFSSDEVPADPDQPRLGGRMAIAAVLPTEAGPICVVSTHLESNADADHRHAQFDRLLRAIDAFAPDMPVLIGGDLNTGNHLPPDFDWQRETLFELARAQGYDWSATPDGVTTRPSLITPHPDRQMKLDWFCTRGMRSTENRLVSSVDENGRPLSDHDAVWCRVALD